MGGVIISDESGAELTVFPIGRMYGSGIANAAYFYRIYTTGANVSCDIDHYFTGALWDSSTRIRGWMWVDVFTEMSIGV